MADPIVLTKCFGGYRRCFLKGKYYRIAFYYYGNSEGSINFEGDPDLAARYKDFETANAARMKIERILEEPLHMTRLSDARKILATQVIGAEPTTQEPEPEEIVL